MYTSGTALTIDTTKGGTASINVDYMYMNGLFCYLEELLINII
jgi:hypothetical protein